ncbi:F-box protein SKIP22 [Acorus calamus]|uniref:F-box protein SKIP22 n=1 Tax=Acorus calamus TaxID=4465 RepID=A0AAV9DI95_ACOCL|nr:F-box protein SKIP22 [Acorus calamus]
MKLRIRSMDSKETVKIEAPPSSTVDDLKTLIAQELSPPPPPSSLRLSLNRKDEIGSSPDESLSSVGLTSGDLVFYSVNPDAFDSVTDITVSRSGDEQTLTLEPNPVAPPEGEEAPTLDQDPAPTAEVAAEDMDFDEDLVIPVSSSVPFFLEKLLRESAAEGFGAGDRRLLLIAVHAVFLESGFVEVHTFDGPSLMTIRYTVSDVNQEEMGGGGGIEGEHVVVKFMVLGKSVVIYGCLSGKSADTFRLSLDSTKFIPSIEFVKRNIDMMRVMDENDRSCRDSHEKEIFELWKIVKDTLCLPLMIDLCEKKKLSIPACFPFLPTDLKIKILEFLQGADLARAACVSSELKYLSATDNLWKRRLEEEFGLSDNAGLTGICWKDRFASHWMSKKRSERARRSLRFRPARLAPHFPVPFRRPRLFHPFNLNVVGGDYDRFPVIGDRFPAITDIIRGPGRVNFIPRCNLGGFNA